MANEYVSLYRQTLAERQHQYDASISSGEYTPFLYPWDTCECPCPSQSHSVELDASTKTTEETLCTTLNMCRLYFSEPDMCIVPAVYLFVAVAITPRLSVRVARFVRYVAFCLILLHGTYVVSHRRTLWFAGGYGIGLSSAWGAIMSGAVLVCNDISQDFKRLELRHVISRKSDHLQNGSMAKSTASNTSPAIDLRSRKVASVYASAGTEQISPEGSGQPATKPYTLVWQGFPRNGTWPHLLDWTLDLMTSFRGVGWQHRISTAEALDIPGMPAETQELSKSEPGRDSKFTSVSVQNLRSLQLRAFQDLVLNYLLLDFLKTTMMTDPYFLGRTALESPTPWQWLSRVDQAIPIATRVVRLSMSMTGVIAALTLIFSLNALFFATTLPNLVDVSKITRAPLLEPGLYPPMWYPLTTSVMYSGLAGFWGKFWHQMFRFGISEPSRVTIKKFGLDPRGNVARVLQLLMAFSLSGSIHAFGSYTSFSLQRSYPVSGALAFFLCQGLGIFLQTSTVKFLHKRVPSSKSAPLVVRQGLNFMFVLIWLYFTGPLLAEDFARCGVWLFEPVPLSPLRGLGFGPGGKDEGLWTWYQEGSRLMGFWHGDRWWNTALAIY